MNFFEQTVTRVRHSYFLRNADWLWHAVRPTYERLLGLIWKDGLPRNINGTDRILIIPELHSLPETYEPLVWELVMKDIQPGDTIVDVGAFIGLYTVALANRVGETGKVYAFEPDKRNLALLYRQLRINGVEQRTSVFPYVVGNYDGHISFSSGSGSTSKVKLALHAPNNRVEITKLDTIFLQTSLNVLKIDVEGYEEFVLRGAAQLLQDKHRAPRTIFIEVHPYAWEHLGVSSDSLLNLLHEYNYQVTDIEGKVVKKIVQYGEIIARKYNSSTFSTT